MQLRCTDVEMDAVIPHTRDFYDVEKLSFPIDDNLSLRSDPHEHSTLSLLPRCAVYINDGTVSPMKQRLGRVVKIYPSGDFIVTYTCD